MLRLFLTAAILAASACAQPAAGQRAPDFELKTLEGRRVRLSARTAQGPVVLVVLRGFPGYQCPFCDRQVHDFIQSASDFEAAGARVWFVYPGPAGELTARAREFAAGKSFPPGFELVLDPDYAFTKLYNLRWDAPNETAYPSTFLIRRGGEIAFAKTSRSHGGRVPAAEVLEQLRALN